MAYDLSQKRKQYRLVFEDHDDLEVIAKSVTTRRLLEIQEMAEGINVEGKEGVGSKEMLLSLFKAFAPCIVSWNIEDEGEPIPYTVDGLLDLEIDLVMMIIMSWVEAVAGVDPTSGNSSTSGETSPVASLATASRSLNRAS